MIVLGVLFLLFIPVFIIGRCCINCFGGKKVTTWSCLGCCPGDAREGYSKASVRMLTLALFAFTIGAGIFIVIGLAGNGQAMKGLGDSTGDIVKGVEGLRNDVVLTRDRIVAVGTTANDGAQMETAVVKANDIVKTGKDIDSAFDDARGPINALVYVFFLIPLLVVVLAVLAAIFHVTGCKSFILMANSMWFFLFFVCLFCGVFVILDIFLTDACDEVDSFRNDPNSSARKLFNDALGCKTSSVNTNDRTGLNALAVTVREGIQRAQTAGNTADATALQTILDDNVQPLVECLFINGIVADMDDNVCDTMAPGVRMMIAATVFLIIIYTVLSIIYVMGQKRFASHATDAGYDQDYDLGGKAFAAQGDIDYSGYSGDYSGDYSGYGSGSGSGSGYGSGSGSGYGSGSGSGSGSGYGTSGTY